LQQNFDKVQQGFEFQQIATKFRQDKLQRNFDKLQERLQVLMGYNKALSCNKIIQTSQTVVLTNLSQNGEHSKL
jgi:hypothetical protein